MATIPTFPGFLCHLNATTVPSLKLISDGAGNLSGYIIALLEDVLEDEELIGSGTSGVMIYVFSQLGQSDWNVHHHKQTINTCIYVCTNTRATSSSTMYSTNC